MGKFFNYGVISKQEYMDADAKANEAIVEGDLGFYIQRTLIDSPPQAGGLPWHCTAMNNGYIQGRISTFVANVTDIDPLDTSTWTNPPVDWARVNEEVSFVNGEPFFTHGGGPQCVCITHSPATSQWMERKQQAGSSSAVDMYMKAFPGPFSPPENFNSISLEFDPATESIQKVDTGLPSGSSTIGWFPYVILTGGSARTATDIYLRIWASEPFVLRAIGERPYQYGVYLIDANPPLDAPPPKLTVLNEMDIYVSETTDLENPLTLALEFEPAPEGYYYAIVMNAAYEDWDVQAVDADYVSVPPSCTYNQYGSNTVKPIAWSLQSCKDVPCGSKPIPIVTPVETSGGAPMPTDFTQAPLLLILTIVLLAKLM